jgi:EAL domain-containing protein (putative c-di-GMP-specific phosphodiesterase class I)
MSVNLSARQLQEPALVDDVERVLADTGLEPARLTLEITETVLMRDVPLTIDSLARLRRLGVRVAIDDFGTGYSSLSYLQQFPVDLLKIDRSFVAALDGTGADLALVNSILRLAASLHLETVAEGIEDVGQLEALRKLGAGLGQGFYFARPLERESVSGYLDEHAPGHAVVPGRRRQGQAGRRPARGRTMPAAAAPGAIQQTTGPSLEG